MLCEATQTASIAVANDDTDLPLSKPIKGAILRSKTPGIW